MDPILRNYIMNNYWELIGRLPLDNVEESLSIKDSYHTQNKRYLKYQINACIEFLKRHPEDPKVTEWKSEYMSKLQRIEDSYPFPTPNFTDLTNSINNAFFKVESFMNGSLKSYEYFGFYDAFMVLFNLAKSPKIWSIPNCKLIGYYWTLTEQIRYDFYHRVDIVPGIRNIPEFGSDIEELMVLNYWCDEEFDEFTTQDEIDELNRRDSILDIYKPQRIEHTTNSSLLAPTFNEDTLPEIFKILKPFFSSEDIEILKDVIENGKKISQPVVFKGNANVLCDFFKQLLRGQFLTIGVQKHLEAWIQSNFVYTDSKGNPKEIKLKYISDFISASKRPTKNKRLIDVRNEGGRNIIVHVLKTKTTPSHKK